MKIIKRHLFYCNSCGFEYSGPDKEPCSCSFCGAVNELCYVDEMAVEEKAVLDYAKILPVKMSSRKCLNCGTEFLIHPYVEQDFCNNCFHVVCKAVFDKSNGNLTCKQLVEKLRGK